MTWPNIKEEPNNLNIYVTFQMQMDWQHCLLWLFQTGYTSFKKSLWKEDVYFSSETYFQGLDIGPRTKFLTSNSFCQISKHIWHANTLQCLVDKILDGGKIDSSITLSTLFQLNDSLDLVQRTCRLQCISSSQKFVSGIVAGFAVRKEMQLLERHAAWVIIVAAAYQKLSKSQLS